VESKLEYGSTDDDPVAMIQIVLSLDGFAIDHNGSRIDWLQKGLIAVQQQTGMLGQNALTGDYDGVRCAGADGVFTSARQFGKTLGAFVSGNQFQSFDHLGRSPYRKTNLLLTLTKS